MIDNLFIRVEKNLAFKVLAIVKSDLANSVSEGAVIDTVGDTAIIASVEETKLSNHMWESDNSFPHKLQIGHEFIRITQ